MAMFSLSRLSVGPAKPVLGFQHAASFFFYKGPYCPSGVAVGQSLTRQGKFALLSSEAPALACWR